MAEVKKVPALRFKGFSNEWKKCELGALIEITSASRVHKNEWTESGVPFFRSSDVVANYKGLVNEKAFISYELYKELLNKSGSVQKNDLLVTGGGSIGIPYLIMTNEPLYFKDADLLWLKNGEKLNGYFLYTFFSTFSFRRYVNSITHIGTISHYTVVQAKSTPIDIPDKSEQDEIGEFLLNLDKLINLHKTKVNKLTNLKKAMLEKIFPKQGADVPEIRFKGFAGGWEKKQLGKIFDYIPNNTLSRAQLNYGFGLAKNVHYGDVLIKFGELIDAEKEKLPFITDNELASKYKPAQLQNGDVIIADAAEDESVGKCCEVINVGNQIIVSGLHTIAIRPLLTFAPKFLGYFMNSIAYHSQLLRLMQGTKVLSISKTAIKETFIYFPSEIEEQEKIATYFQNLNKTITLHQTELEKLNNLKKACLEKMYV